MLKKICFWLNNSRIFSLPMTIMSWLVIFLWAIKFHGNIINGLAALVGISFAHLATNLFDDYVDYKLLCKDEKFMNSAVKSKCDYIKDGRATLDDVLKTVIIYCSIASLTGIFLTFRAGLPVIWLAFTGGIITLLYAKLSIRALSEAAVGIAFGPLLFEGVFFVMTKTFSLEVFVLSLAVVMFTIGLLFTHTLLDYDGDVISHKKTLCIKIGDKLRASYFLGVIYLLGYLFTIVFTIMTNNYYILITFLTLPMSINLIKYMIIYIDDKTNIPKVKLWNYPLDNWAELSQEITAPFYFRLFQARNLMMYFSLLFSLALILSLHR